MDEGNKREFEQLLKDNLKVLYSVALRLTKNTHDAEDIVADACVAAWKHFPSLRDHSKFKYWILRIVTNMYLSTYRKQKSRPQILAITSAHGEADGEPFSLFDQLSSPFLLWEQSSEKVFLDGLMVGDVTRAIDSLPIGFRLVVSLCCMENLSYQEAARTLGIPIGTVRSRLYRGKSMLQKLLWDYASRRRSAGEGVR